MLQETFSSGPEVTKVCLICHTEAAKQLHKTKHWTWNFRNPKTGQSLGKKNLVNNFRGAVTTNYAICTSCHIGFGWHDDSFDFGSEENVDCLSCHDTTGTYKKFPLPGGHPAYLETFPDCDRCHGTGTPTPLAGNKFTALTEVSCEACHGDAPHPAENDMLNEHSDRVTCQACHVALVAPGNEAAWKGPDWGNIARNVGLPTRQNCGRCHFFSGGGDGVKHGDMDTSLIDAKREVDVHMESAGLNFQCRTCHRTERHQVPGSRYVGLAKDLEGIVIPGKNGDRVSCESCHSDTPHPRTVNNKLNHHIGKIACQTCHIPEFARGGVATQLWWDWSTAGKLSTFGTPLITRTNGHAVYDARKGDAKFEENVIPEYRWFDGDVKYTLMGDIIDPSKEVEINSFASNHDSPNARIWPFKIMRGRQPYDTENKTLAIAHIYGNDDTAYRKNFDWDLAIETGMETAGIPYSGQYDFIETAMYWPITHMVAPKSDALACNACHSKQGRLHYLTGFYMPGRDSSRVLDFIGWAAVLLTAIGVLIHIITHAVTLCTNNRSKH